MPDLINPWDSEEETTDLINPWADAPAPEETLELVNPFATDTPDEVGVGDTDVELADTSVPDSALLHLEDREGDRDVVYRDSLGKLTAGVGHLLTEDDLLTLKEGDAITPEQKQEWLAADTGKAWKAAQAQAKELGKPDLAEGLFHVNYQLGTEWNKEHKKTWALMQEGDFTAAADEAANSTWNSQTPVRVEDFQAALRDMDESESDSEPGTIMTLADRVRDRFASLFAGGAQFAQSAGARLEEDYPMGGFIPDDESSFGFKYASPEEFAAQQQKGTDILTEAATSLRNVGESYTELNSWEDVKHAWSDPKTDAWDTTGTIIKYGMEMGVASIPDMVGILAAAPAYVTARTGEIAQERATNDGREIESQDMAIGGLTALAVTALDKFGLDSMMATKVMAGQQSMTKALIEGFRNGLIGESFTEGAQELLEYMATNYKTEKGATVMEALDVMLAAMVGGGVYGAPAGALGNVVRARSQTDPTKKAQLGGEMLGEMVDGAEFATSAEEIAVQRMQPANAGQIVADSIAAVSGAATIEEAIDAGMGQLNAQLVKYGDTSEIAPDIEMDLGDQSALPFAEDTTASIDLEPGVSQTLRDQAIDAAKAPVEPVEDAFDKAEQAAAEEDAASLEQAQEEQDVDLALSEAQLTPQAQEEEDARKKAKDLKEEQPPSTAMAQALRAAAVETQEDTAPKVGDMPSDVGTNEDAVYYHGTTEDFKEFEPGKTAFISTSPEVGGEFAKGSGGNIRQVRLKAGKYFDPSNQEHIDEVKADYADKYMNDPTQVDYFFEQMKDRQMIEGSLLEDLLREKGFDGYLIPEESGVAVFDSGNLSSLSDTAAKDATPELKPETTQSISSAFNSPDFKGGRISLTDQGVTAQEISQLQKAGLATDGLMDEEQYKQLPQVEAEESQAETEPVADEVFTVGDLDSEGALPDIYDITNKPDYWREEKGVEIDVQHMSPDEYIDAAVVNLQKHRKEATRSGVVEQRQDTPVREEYLQYGGRNKVENMVAAMRDGVKYEAPSLDYSRGKAGQEGLHRALAAKELGMESIPVIVQQDPKAETKEKPLAEIRINEDVEDETGAVHMVSRPADVVMKEADASIDGLKLLQGCISGS